MPGRLWSGMSKIDEYRRGLAFCQANAAKAGYHELKDLWTIAEEGYAFLIELESKPRDGLSFPMLPFE
jgi:hypothetical protein